MWLRRKPEVELSPSITLTPCHPLCVWRALHLDTSTSAGRRDRSQANAISSCLGLFLFFCIGNTVSPMLVDGGAGFYNIPILWLHQMGPFADNTLLLILNELHGFFVKLKYFIHSGLEVAQSSLLLGGRRSCNLWWSQEDLWGLRSSACYHYQQVHSAPAHSLHCSS